MVGIRAQPDHMFAIIFSHLVVSAKNDDVLIHAVPLVEFDKSRDVLPVPSTSNGTTSAQTRLERYLTYLTLRPSNESPLELLEGNSSSARPGHKSTASYNETSPSSSTEEEANPESDSFAYIETLLEALAVLGKLVGALDTVVQRLPVELYNLVASTTDEVNDRSEFLRGSTTGVATGSSGYVFVDGVVRPSEAPMALRLGALEASAKETDHETLRDLFWTLYSKLDAVVQGFRVTYEVANRIGQVGVFLAWLSGSG